MKKVLCCITAAFLLLPSALCAQDFNPAAGPLEGVWTNETNAEDVLIFAGNLALLSTLNFRYDVIPDILYRNGEILAPDESGSRRTEYSVISTYELSGKTLKLAGVQLTGESQATVYTRAGDDILRTRSRLEGVWTSRYQYPGETSVRNMTCIFKGELMILLVESDTWSNYSAARFTWSDTSLAFLDGSTTAYTISGNLLTIQDDTPGSSENLVLTRK
jgi:hypothetical protein